MDYKIVHLIVESRSHATITLHTPPYCPLFHGSFVSNEIWYSFYFLEVNTAFTGFHMMYDFLNHLPKIHLLTDFPNVCYKFDIKLPDMN